MARVPMVTRTIITTKCNVLCMDLVKCEPFNKEVILPRTFKDNSKLMKAVSALIDDDETKAVHVVDKEELSTLYGMSEQKFIHYAEVLPPRKATQDNAEN